MFPYMPMPSGIPPFLVYLLVFGGLFLYGKAEWKNWQNKREISELKEKVERTRSNCRSAIHTGAKRHMKQKEAAETRKRAKRGGVSVKEILKKEREALKRYVQ